MKETEAMIQEKAGIEQGVWISMGFYQRISEYRKTEGHLVFHRHHHFHQ